MKTNHRRTLVLNADYMPLTIISWQRAIVLLIEDRVHQVDFYKDDKIRDGHGRCYPIPAVVARKDYIKRDSRHAPFCKKNIFIRDQLTCAYCNRRFEPRHLTFDHVIPRSKWGGQGSPTCWENIVTCCLWCNRKKANKSCKDANMFPIKYPVRPAYGELFLGLSPWRDNIPEEWIPHLQYLPLFRGLHGQEAKVQ
jgi:5-methylcytosine-specific restriction endonuclease McrA